MEFHRHRHRRIIYNDDANQQYSGRKIAHDVTDVRSFIDARTTPTFDTQVDTYVWCVGNGCDPPWGTMYTVQPCLGSCEHATDLIVQACHDRQMEVWGSLRINDLHDRRRELHESNDPLKAEHPEYLIGTEEHRDMPPERIERYLVTAFNFERPEVRKYRLDYIERNASAHDFDGYELDFTRFIWTLPLGRERELAPIMTDFVRQTRATLNAIGDKRGRPYIFVIHVMDSVEASLSLGRDVEAWLSEGLIDVLVVGMGYQPFTLRLDQWHALSKRYDVPIYPSLNVRNLRRFYEDNRVNRQSAWHEYIRGAAAWWWLNNADGFYMFNLFTHEDECGLDAEMVHAPLREIGDPATLGAKNKIYCIESHAISGMLSQGSEAVPLPIPLDIHERRLPLAMGPDAEDPRAPFKIQARTTGGGADTKVWMRLNHRLLEPVCQDGCCEVPVPAGLMRPGRNEFTMFCSVPLSETNTPVIVHEVLTLVTYTTDKYIAIKDHKWNPLSAKSASRSNCSSTTTSLPMLGPPTAKSTNRSSIQAIR